MFPDELYPTNMVSTGDPAPDFTAPLANGSIEKFTLSEALEEESPIILAFFPAAFSTVCSHEMSAFQDRIGTITETGARLIGVSVDMPHSLNEFRDVLSLDFDIISDTNRRIIDAYDLSTTFSKYSIDDVAERAVFVIDESGTITYSWVGENFGIEPDYEAIEAAAADAA